MLFYRATHLSPVTRAFVAELIAGHRDRIGSRWRALNPGRQALLVLCTCAATRPSLVWPPRSVSVWRPRTATSPRSSRCWPTWHRTCGRKCESQQAPPARGEHPVPDRPARPADLGVAGAAGLDARSHRRPHTRHHRRAHQPGDRLLRRQGIRRRGRRDRDALQAPKAQLSGKRNKLFNRHHAQVRAPGEQDAATLKSWRILRKARCSPSRLTTIVQAILTLHHPAN